MTRRFAAAALLGAIFFACGPRGEKPPPPTCAGKCAPTVVIPVGQPPPDGQGGADSDAGADDDPVRLVGEIRLLDDLALFSGPIYGDPAEISVEGRDREVRGSWTGSDPTFSIEGVRRADVVWAQVTPAFGDALRTLQPVDTRTGSDVVERPLTVVRASALDLAFNVLTLPVVRNENLAQAILVATNGGVPARGIRVNAPGAETVVYAASGTFSDDVVATDATGIVVLANVPGNAITVELSGEVVGRWDVRLVTGGVTVAAAGD